MYTPRFASKPEHGPQGRTEGIAINPKDCILFSGAAAGAEEEFGLAAERNSIEEINFSFEGHNDSRRRGIRTLNHEELLQGDVSLEYVSRMMHRQYPNTPLFKKVLQTIWHQVNAGQEIYVVGKILEDLTVRGGTGWGAEFAKLCNKPLFVFDQDRDGWFRWTGQEWSPHSEPVIQHIHFTGTGTRSVEANGKKAIEALFRRSFE